MNGTDKTPSDDQNPADKPVSEDGTESAEDNVTSLHGPGGDDSEAPDRLSPEADADTRTYEELFMENAELKDRLLRTLADSENLRRRGQREKEDAAKYAISAFARDLLDVQDNLIRALAALSPEDKAAGGEKLEVLYDGVEMTQRVLNSAFERHKIVVLQPGGEKFDPNFHQAVAEIPGTEHPHGTVVDVMQPGYLIGDRLLRPAMVTVSKGAPAAGSGGTEPGGTVDTNA